VIVGGEGIKRERERVGRNEAVGGGVEKKRRWERHEEGGREGNGRRGFGRGGEDDG